MSILTDITFVPQLSPYLDKFKHKGGYMWACRCPYCGDSQKNKNKTRGGFYRKHDKILFNCFNCGVSTTLGKVIEHLDLQLYKTYRLAKYKDSCNVDSFITNRIEMPKPKDEIELSDTSLDLLIPITELDEDHDVVKYIKNRKIPNELWNLFYYTQAFKEYTNEQLPGKFSNLNNDHPRLVLPYLNEHGRMFAYAGRSLNGEEPKYITIKLVESEEKVYGRERLDYSKLILVVEGQIDSVLLSNCISVSGSSFDTPFIRGIKTNAVLVPDNEPRNSAIVQQYNKYINEGYRVCMLPETFEFKDINEAIIGGMTSNEIRNLILDNTYQGLEAKAKFANWRKTGDVQRISKPQSNSLLERAHSMFR